MSLTIVEIRRRQAVYVIRRLPGVMQWQPAVTVAIVGAVYVATTPSMGADPTFRLRTVGVAMCAAIAFTLDDAASVTTSSSPVTLIERRAARMFVVLSMAALWWLALVELLAMPRFAVPRSPWQDLGELATYTAVGLAGSAWGARRSDDQAGGTAGAVILLALFGSSLLAMPAWWPLREAAMSGASSRLGLVLVPALAVLIMTSLVPRRRWRSGWAAIAERRVVG